MISNSKSLSKLDYQTVQNRILSNPFVHQGQQHKEFKEHIDLHFSLQETFKYILKLRESCALFCPDIIVHVDRLEQSTKELLRTIKPEKKRSTVDHTPIFKTSMVIPPPPLKMNIRQPHQNKLKK